MDSCNANRYAFDFPRFLRTEHARTNGTYKMLMPDSRNIQMTNQIAIAATTT
jgi:hypothetical protein